MIQNYVQNNYYYIDLLPLLLIYCYSRRNCQKLLFSADWQQTILPVLADASREEDVCAIQCQKFVLVKPYLPTTFLYSKSGRFDRYVLMLFSVSQRYTGYYSFCFPLCTGMKAVNSDARFVEKNSLVPQVSGLTWRRPIRRPVTIALLQSPLSWRPRRSSFNAKSATNI